MEGLNMAFDEEDMKAQSKIINTASSDRLDRAEQKQGEEQALKAGENRKLEAKKANQAKAQR